MKMVIQRVSYASVTVEDTKVGSIHQGFLILLGISQEDTKEIADKMVQKMLKLRIFSDENGKTNLSLKEVRGALLIVSQFTLYADCKKGNQPSFIKAGEPNLANELYEYVLTICKKEVEKVESGVFGAEMQVELSNDGPFTILLDSAELFG